MMALLKICTILLLTKYVLHWIQTYFCRHFSFIKKQYVSKSNMLHLCCSQQQLLIKVNIIFMLKNFSLIKIYPSENK